MAIDKKISQLTAATTPLAGTEVLPIVQSASTVKVSVDNLTTGKDVPCLSVTPSSLTASTILGSDSGKKVVSLSTTTYPSLTELSYVKGVTSALQTQLDLKAPLISPSFTTPALGTPTAGVLTSCTGLPVSTGVSGLGTGVATFLATPSSANLGSALTDKTGTGLNVCATSPSFTTPALGTPTAGVLTSCTGLPMTTGVTGTLGVSNGGTGTATTFTAGSVVFAGASGIYGQNNSGLFWDNSNTRLGIGTASPSYIIHAIGQTPQLLIKASSGTAHITADSASGSNSWFKLQENGTAQWSIGQVSLDGSPLAFSTGGTLGVPKMVLTGAGRLGLGLAAGVYPNASSIVDFTSTTLGVLLPRMTTTQKNAISTPASGLIVYDTTLGKLCVRGAAAWETITSV